MEQLLPVVLISIPCLVLPMNALAILSMIGVMLADTRLIPQDYIYLTRFVPMGVFCFRALISFVFKKSFKVGSFYIVKVWAPFLCLILISAIYSLEPLITIQRILSAFLVVIGFGIGIPFYFNHPDKVSRILRQLTIIIGGATLFSLFQQSWKTPVITDLGEFDRLQGIFVNPNTLGLLGMQIIFLFFYWWDKSKEKKIGKILLGAIIAIGVIIIISGSRAALLGLSVGLLVYIWTAAKVQKRVLPGIWTTALILVSAFLIAGIFFPEFLGGLLRTETSSRTILWERAWELSQDAPYLGVGFGGSDRLFQQDVAYLQSMQIFVAGSHSSLMRLLVELGFTGVILAVFAFSVLIHRIWKLIPQLEDPKLGIALLCITAASLTNAFFESWLFGFGSASTVPFWFFLALLCHQSDQAKIKLRIEKQRWQWAKAMTQLRTITNYKN